MKLINELIVDLINKLGTSFNDIMATLVVLLALQWFVRFDILSLGGVNKSFHILNSKIKRMNAYGPDNLKKLHLMINLRTNKYVRNAWIAYYNDYTQKGPRTRNPDIREYFNLTSVITIPTARRKSESVPGIVTTIGILAAFIASFAGSDRGIEQIADKMLAAFSIIIVAVLASVVYQLADKFLYHSTVSKLYAFTGLIDQKIPPLVPTADISEVQETNQQQTQSICDTMEKFLVPSLETISEMQLKITKMISETQSEGVSRMVEAFVEKINSGMHEQFETMKENTIELMEFQNKSKQILSDVMTDMAKNDSEQKEINSMMKDVMSSLSGYNEKVALSQGQIAKSLEKTESFVSMLTGILDANREMSERINEQRLAMQKENAEYFEKTSLTTQNVTEGMNEQINDILNRFTQMTTQTFDKLAGVMNEPINKLTEKLNALLENNVDSTQEMKESSKRITEELNTQIEGIFSGFTELTSGTIEKLEKTMSEPVGKLSESMSTMLDNNVDYFEKMNKNSQRMSDDLNFQVESIFARFTELSTSIFEKLETTMNEPLNKLSERMGTMLENMDEQVRNISLYSKELSIEVSELNKNLVGSVKEFSDQIDSGVKSTLGTFDEGLGEISSRFGTILSDIKDSTDEISQVAGDLMHRAPGTGDHK